MKTIRPAKPHECQQLSELAYRSKAHWGYSEIFMTACQDELTYTAADLQNDLFQVLVEEDELLGFYALTKISSTSYELDALFIEPNVIGQGNGKVLMDHAKQTARQAGATDLIIQSDPNAANFYMKVGAKLTGQRESDSIPGRYLPLLICSL